MHAKLIFAAVAALCCVQGIAARSVQPLAVPWNQSIKDKIDGLALSEVEDVDQSMDLLMTMAEELFKVRGGVNVDPQELQLHAEVLRGDKNKRGILGCVTSFVSAFKTAKLVKELVDEWRQAKATLKADQLNCQAAADGATHAPLEPCMDKANETYNQNMTLVKNKIPDLALKVGTSVFAFRKCFGLP